MSTVTVELLGVARWGCSGERGAVLAMVEAPGGEVDISDERVYAAVTAAHAAGTLRIVEGAPMEGVVEHDEASLEKQRVAEEAIAPLFEDRDRELAAPVTEELDPGSGELSDVLGPDAQVVGETQDGKLIVSRPQTDEERAEVVERYSALMAETAQAALEG